MRRLHEYWSGVVRAGRDDEDRAGDGDMDDEDEEQVQDNLNDTKKIGTKAMLMIERH